MCGGRCGRATVSLLAALVILAAAGTAGAGEARTHDGFFLRLSGGGGYAESKFEDATDETGIRLGDLKLSGASADVNLAIGATVAPNLAIHGTLWGWLVEDPDVSLAGLSGTVGGATLDMSAFGAGITYYFMPLNLYVSPSVGAAELSIEEGGVTLTTDTGFALDLTVGKEWWVGDGWGIGVAGGYSYHSVPDGLLDRNWTGSGFGLRFSATMN